MIQDIYINSHKILKGIPSVRDNERDFFKTKGFLWMKETRAILIGTLCACPDERNGPRPWDP